MAYLIWSHQHGGWWRPGGFGYTPHVGDAGRFDRERALEICRAALPGQYKPGGPFPELPVLEDDLIALVTADVVLHPYAQLAAEFGLDPAEIKREGE
jgi:hypothetical protein